MVAKNLSDAELLERSRRQPQKSFEQEWADSQREQASSIASTRSDEANAEWDQRPEPVWTLKNPAKKFRDIYKNLGVPPEKIADHSA